MDGVLCNWEASYIKERKRNPGIPYPQAMPGFFVNLEPMLTGITAVKLLSAHFDMRICTAPSNRNPLSYTEKRLWVENHLGYEYVEGLTITSYKNDIKGDFLIDDRTDSHGQKDFEGELIHFGSERFPDWSTVYHYLLSQKG